MRPGASTPLSRAGRTHRAMPKDRAHVFTLKQAAQMSQQNEWTHLNHHSFGKDRTAQTMSGSAVPLEQPCSPARGQHTSHH